MQNESNIMPYSINIKSQDLNSLSIVTLYYEDCRSFQFFNDQMDIHEFNNIKDCSNFIANNQTSSSIFLIISMNSPFDIQSLIKLSAVHAVYVVSDTISYDLLKTVSSSKISGMFAQYDDLLVQLVVDICFYRQMTFHIPKMSVCTTQANIFEQPDKHRIEFLRLQLFIDIIDDLRFLSDDHFAFAPFHDNNQQLYLPVNTIETSVIINQLFKQSVFNVLMKSSFQLSNIERLLESIPKKTNALSVTLYRAQLLSEEYLQIIRDNPNFLFKIHTMIVASRSFQTVSTICRRAVDNGLPVAMLEIIIPGETSLSHLDSSIVIFRLGIVFRLVSIDLTPDGVYHIQLKPDDTAMQYIKAQIQAEIGEHPTWLTYGNCLAALKQFGTARDYYHYILKFLPLGHRSNAAVCNNMGLIYSAMNKDYEDLKASELFNIARCLVIIDTWTPVGTDELDKIEAERLQSQPTIRTQVKRKIAEVQALLEQLIKTEDFESKHELI
jgi:tetratricopeptide (TPR) repeat protein